mmetsp:Transcript_2616/g.4455  ORF Transcript_2616/g.4455 Transcript_2616/m.4455 type:complete len:331 (+) Transcript_2616:31-1023(+)
MMQSTLGRQPIRSGNNGRRCGTVQVPRPTCHTGCSKSGFLITAQKSPSNMLPTSHNLHDSPELQRRHMHLGLASLIFGLWQCATPPAQADGLRPMTEAEQAAVDKVFRGLISKTKAPVALRLPFHDAGTYSMAQRDGGANASVRFELERPESQGLKRGWRIIEQAAKELKSGPASSLSSADLIVLAGAAAVRVCGGPVIPVLVGRLDATGPDPEGRLPSEESSAEQLKKNFAEKGISAREMLVLSGAHTLGNKGFGDAATFDNQYFKSLLQKPWLDPSNDMALMIGLPSDHVLPDDPEFAPMIQEYAVDQALFFKDFSAAYVKLSELGCA